MCTQTVQDTRDADIQKAPSAETSDGVVVVNFSSPHRFEMTDGTVLEACHATRVRELQLTQVEEKRRRHGWTDISISYKLTIRARWAIEHLEGDEEVDVILVSRVFKDAWREAGWALGKIRTARFADRDGRVVHHDVFYS